MHKIIFEKYSIVKNVQRNNTKLTQYNNNTSNISNTE